MTYYVIIDTNVLVSALLSSKENSAVSIILDKIFDGQLIPVFSKQIFEEYEAVLMRPKFNFNHDLINLILHLLKKQGIMLKPRTINIQLNDMKDLPFYEIAMFKEDSFLITGNLKHFPICPRIMSPREFLNFITINV